MSRQLTALTGRLALTSPSPRSPSPSSMIARLLSNSVHQGKVFKHSKSSNGKWKHQDRKQHQQASAAAAVAATGAPPALQQQAAAAAAAAAAGGLLNGQAPVGENVADRWGVPSLGPALPPPQREQGTKTKNGQGVGSAAQFRQQQAQATQRGQSILGSGALGSAAGKMDVATFQRFSNIQERLERARSNGQGQQQQHHHHQGPKQHPRSGKNGSGNRKNPQQAQQAQQPSNGARTNGAALFPPLPSVAVNGAAARRSRWARIENAPPVAPAAAETAAGSMSGQARLWEADEEEDEAAAAFLRQQQNRREGRARGQQQQQHRQQGQGQGQQAGAGPKKRFKGPRLDRRLRLLTRVPLVLPHEPITVRELSQKLAMKMKDVGKRLVRLGGREEYGNLTPESLVDLDVAELLGLEMGRTVKRMEPEEDLLEYKSRSRESRPDWPLRAPVVCVMGHVDHGKTTLLDALRKTSVAVGEAGGITQRLGAFHIPSGLATPGKEAEEGKEEEEEEGEGGSLGITVLDTPGHAAFGAMRLNGALATDIVLLVVSASDGVQAQTEEVLRLARQEGVALVVAVTKVDKLASEGETQERLRAIEQELAAHGVMPESLGGEVQVVPVSARKGLGLAELRERLALQAEVLELRADRRAPGEGLLLDCYVDKGLGVVANVLVRWGALKAGDVVVAGEQWGRVKRVLDEAGQTVGEALPSMPVRVLGFKELPSPGEGLIVVRSEERAQAVAEARRAARERRRLEEAEEVEAMDEEDEEQLREMVAGPMANVGGKKTKAFLAMQRGAAEDLLQLQLPEGAPTQEGSAHNSRQSQQQQQQQQQPVVVPFLVKADGKGTLDAVTAALAAYQSDVIRAEVIGAGCGAVTEGDLERALAAGESVGGRPCTVLAFGVGFAHAEVGEQARRAGVAVRRQSVIYSLLDDVKETLQRHMPMARVETPVGKLEVQATFALTGRRRTKNRVAGCRVLQGSAFSGPGYRYRVRRGEAVLCDESAPSTLYHFKEQVQEVGKGMECGLSLEAFGDFQPGDAIEVYTVEERPGELREVFRY